MYFVNLIKILLYDTTSSEYVDNVDGKDLLKIIKNYDYENNTKDVRTFADDLCKIIEK